MKKYGFNKTPDGNYTNGKISITDVSPENIGYTEDGHLRLFDSFIYRRGGRMQNK